MKTSKVLLGLTVVAAMAAWSIPQASSAQCLKCFMRTCQDDWPYGGYECYEGPGYCINTNDCAVLAPRVVVSYGPRVSTGIANSPSGS